METHCNSVLLDASVVVRHFRDSNGMASKLADYEQLCLPPAALAELYAGAFGSSQAEKDLRQIAPFLEA